MDAEFLILHSHESQLKELGHLRELLRREHRLGIYPLLIQAGDRPEDHLPKLEGVRLKGGLILDRAILESGSVILGALGLKTHYWEETLSWFGQRVGGAGKLAFGVDSSPGACEFSVPVGFQLPSRGPSLPPGGITVFPEHSESGLVAGGMDAWRLAHRVFGVDFSRVLIRTCLGLPVRGDELRARGCGAVRYLRSPKDGVWSCGMRETRRLVDELIEKVESLVRTSGAELEIFASELLVRPEQRVTRIPKAPSDFVARIEVYTPGSSEVLEEALSFAEVVWEALASKKVTFSGETSRAQGRM